MANGRGQGRKGDSGRDPGGFVALPWSVLDSAAYGRLSHPARSLLMEFARQFVRDNNGRLLAAYGYLSKRGWRSADVITRAKRELLEAGFIYETVKGQRPNKASWYAITWRALDHLPGYDIGARLSFERGAYRCGPLLPDVAKLRGQANRSLRPSNGVARSAIAPSDGVGVVATAPSHGAIKTLSEPRSTPPHGNHLDMPSAGARQPTH